MHLDTASLELLAIVVLTFGELNILPMGLSAELSNWR